MTTTRSLCLLRHEVTELLATGRAKVIREMNPQPRYPGVNKISFDLHPFAPSTLVGTPAEGIAVAPEEYVWIEEDWCGNIVGVLQASCPFGKVGGVLAAVSVVTHVEYDGVRTHPPTSHNYNVGTVQVDAVSCKPVQSITEDELACSGFPNTWTGQFGYGGGVVQVIDEYGIDNFTDYFRKLHGPDAWDRNDYVWLGEIRRVEK